MLGKIKAMPSVRAIFSNTVLYSITIQYWVNIPLCILPNFHELRFSISRKFWMVEIGTILSSVWVPGIVTSNAFRWFSWLWVISSSRSTDKYFSWIFEGGYSAELQSALSVDFPFYIFMNSNHFILKFSVHLLNSGSHPRFI